jgi:hypothetical protein
MIGGVHVQEFMPQSKPRMNERSHEASHVEWLLNGPVRDTLGGVWSWANPWGRGFPYLEAAGLLLSLHCESLARDEDSPRVRHDCERIVSWIVPRLRGGVVAHRGGDYAFDTAIVIAGLDRWSRVSDTRSLAVRAAIAGGRTFLRSCLSDSVGQRGREDDGHWSRSFGPHLLKLGLAVEDPALQSLADQFVDTCWDGEHFRVHANSSSWYAHAHAYALEGLLALHAQGYAIDMSVVDAGLDTLRRAVRETGTSTDVAAQLVRIGLLRGWASEDDGLHGAWERIASRTQESGGVLYRDDSEDVNTWATIFMVQARRWSRIGADITWLA